MLPSLLFLASLLGTAGSMPAHSLDQHRFETAVSQGFRYLVHLDELNPPRKKAPKEELLKDLESDDANTRWHAVNGLEPYAKWDRVVRDRLREHLRDPSIYVKSLTIVVLGPFAGKEEAIREDIKREFLVKDIDDSIKFSGMDALWPFIETDLAIKSRIREFLWDRNLYVRAHAAEVFGRAGSAKTDPAISQDLVQLLLEDDTWFIARGLASSSAALALGPVCAEEGVREALIQAAVRGVWGAQTVLQQCAS